MSLLVAACMAGSAFSKMRPCRRRAILLGGDTAVLFLFAAIGRRNHGEGLQLAETFNTALPFLVGALHPSCSASHACLVDEVSITWLGVHCNCLLR